MSVQGYVPPVEDRNPLGVVDNVGGMMAVVVVVVAQAVVDEEETGWVVSRLSQGADVSLVAPVVVL
jgi:hypothetical protein